MMKCLTICQPWAWAIVHGPKRVENRSWYTSYRGPLLIHAGKSRDWLIDELPDGSRVPHEQLVFGAIIGIVELVDCVPYRRDPRIVGDPFAFGPDCWLLRNVRPIDPIPYRGKQGLFDVPDSVLTKPKATPPVDAGAEIESLWHREGR